MFDFTKLNTASTPSVITDPRSVFQTLQKKKPEKYQYPRDVQTEVWNDWHTRKDENDLVVKLNTGGGKTTVGLCILKSCLNEKIGPAVYVAPNELLVSQVISEANDLGVDVTDDIASWDFLSGNSIFVCNIDKIVNGRSVFGVNQKKIDVGSIIFDDAHACIQRISEKFSIEIPLETKCYNEIFNLFSISLQKQSSNKHLSIECGDPQASIKVPYWSWQDSIREVISILNSYKNEEYLEWAFPLLSENLDLCDCIISGSKIEISTTMIPINVIPSISGARRRIFMTATLSDDSVLATHFGVSESSLGRPITPSQAGDIGERMILAPQEISMNFTETSVREMCKELSKDQNVVVIVPSNKRASLWSKYADRIFDANNIAEGVELLNSNPKAGLCVMVNRYDGIDLPGSACRVLVIDGLPEYKSLSRRYEEMELSSSSLGHRDLIHKVEQGMGRGVRSNSDYCVVLLIGTDLISKLYLEKATQYFSPGTRAQLDLSKELTRGLRTENQTIESLNQVISACLNRDPNWRDAASQRMLNLKFDPQVIDNVTSTIRRAYDLYFTLPQDALKIIETVPRLKNFDAAYHGYLKQIVAKYMHKIDPANAQQIQRSAVQLNSRLLKPLVGIVRTPNDRKIVDQATNINQYLSGKYSNGNEIVLACNAIVENLSFSEIAHTKFEKALSDAGFFIGFTASMPDQEEGTGPDVFWHLGPDWGVLLECKNEAKASSIPKSYCNQLSGHLNWHNNAYGQMCKVPIPVMVHPASVVQDPSAVPNNMHLLNGQEFESFKTNLLNFAAALANDNNYLSSAKIEQLIRSFKFLPELFVNHYLREYK